MTWPMLFARLPPTLGEFYARDSPWSLLGDALDAVLGELPSERLRGLIEPGVHLSGDRIVVEKGARIRSGAVIEGPAYIGEDCELRSGASLRGGVWLGPGAIVGANTEVKRAIFLDRAKAPHLNYVGDSILGIDVNLGAGTILSNFRHGGGPIAIGSGDGAVATGLRKLGAVLGDGVLTGCNSVLHPGCVVGARTRIYPGVQLRSGVYPADRIIKLRQTLEVVALRNE